MPAAPARRLTAFPSIVYATGRLMPGGRARASCRPGEAIADEPGAGGQTAGSQSVACVRLGSGWRIHAQRTPEQNAGSISARVSRCGVRAGRNAGTFPRTLGAPRMARRARLLEHEPVVCRLDFGRRSNECSAELLDYGTDRAAIEALIPHDQYSEPCEGVANSYCRVDLSGGGLQLQRLAMQRVRRGSRYSRLNSCFIDVTSSWA
jgi:hypothetical protein